MEKAYIELLLAAFAFYIFTDARRPHLGRKPKPAPLRFPLWFWACALAFNAAMLCGAVWLVRRLRLG